jgi:hypothetical protein
LHKIKVGDGATRVNELPFVEGALSSEEIEGIIAQKSQVQIITWEDDD